MRLFPFRIISINGTTVDYLPLDLDDNIHFAAVVHLKNSNTVTMVFLRNGTDTIGELPLPQCLPIQKWPRGYDLIGFKMVCPLSVGTSLYL